MPRSDVLRLLHGIWAADYEEWDAERDVTVTRFGAGIHLALDDGAQVNLPRPAH